MDLDLDVVPTGIGRKPVAVTAEIVRALTESDLALLATERGIKPSQIQRLSERHHALARCLATGLSVADACAITGYTASRVSILKGDPSFEELIAFYQRGGAELVQDLGAKLLSNARAAADELANRLEDSPEELSVDALHDTIKIGADRTGFGPQSRSQHLHVHMNLADRLAAARKRAEPGPLKVIEGSSAAPTISGDASHGNVQRFPASAEGESRTPASPPLSPGENDENS